MVPLFSLAPLTLQGYCSQLYAVLSFARERFKVKRSLTGIAPVILLVGLVLAGLACAPQAALDSCVTRVGIEVAIERVGDPDCLVRVGSHGDGQQFELAVGESVTITEISQPIGVVAVRQ